MINTPSTYDNIPRLAEAIAKVERLIQECQDYIDAGQDNRTNAEHPKPCEKRAEDVFFELQKAICANICLVGVVDIHHITLMIDHMMQMEFVDPFGWDIIPLVDQMADILEILDARKKTQQLFAGGGPWGRA